MIGRAVAPRSILVVDDEPHIADLMAVMLKRSGARTHIVYSGRDALRAIRAVEFDTVLLDWNMPGLTGEQIAAEIRSGWPDTKIIAVSGSLPISFRSAISAGLIDAFVQKPFKTEALQRAIECVATRQRSFLAVPA